MLFKDNINDQISQMQTACIAEQVGPAFVATVADLGVAALTPTKGGIGPKLIGGALLADAGLGFMITSRNLSAIRDAANEARKAYGIPPTP